MKHLFIFLSKYFWLIAIAITLINTGLFRWRAQKNIDENPTLKTGYQRLIRNYLVWMNVPWLIMGVGCTYGGVPSIWHYFRPKDGNPYVLAWFGSVFLIWIFVSYWLFFRHGAEELAKYPGVFSFNLGLQQRSVVHPVVIKLLYLVMLACGIAGVFFLWFANLAIPNFQ